ncbi:MAG: hypothetical protein CML29_01855 [Rhizobiales bacterium]|nr:hypothetical protein [Hyphomicrobiales bacterium]|tara:strand:- start:1292 stop:1498 length:207 start_codon:yes stop_codon:yes gene_type:complete
MNETKAWYQSKSVWGSIITIASMVATVAGSPIAPADQQSLITLTTTAAGSVGAIIALVGRLVAKNRIG